MARLAVTVTVLFFVFAFSNAHTPLNFPENEITDFHQSNSLPESDNKATILLPSEKPDSEPANVGEIETEATEIHPDESAKDLPESETEAIDAVPLTQPLTVVSFRPVNGHSQLKRPFSFRFSRRGCGHRFKPMNPRFHGREVSYGNDMILSGENSDFDPMMFDIMRHRHHHHDGMPGSPFKHHHHHHHHDDEKENFKGAFRHHHHEEEKEESEDKDREEREEGGFMMRFRKFLNHY